MKDPRALKCPACGASLEVRSSAEQAYECRYCGTHMLVQPSSGEAQVVAEPSTRPAPVEPIALSASPEPEPRPTTPAEEFRAEALLRFRVSEEQAWQRVVDSGSWWGGPSKFRERVRKIEAVRVFVPCWVFRSPDETRIAPFWKKSELPLIDVKPESFPLDDLVPCAPHELGDGAIEPALDLAATRTLFAALPGTVPTPVLLPIWWFWYECPRSGVQHAVINGATGRLTSARPTGGLSTVLGPFLLVFLGFLAFQFVTTLIVGG